MSFFLELLFLFKTQVGETKKRLTDVANEGKQLVQPVPHNTRGAESVCSPARTGCLTPPFVAGLAARYSELHAVTAFWSIPERHRGSATVLLSRPTSAKQ